MDIINFLKQKRGGIVIRSFGWWGPIRSRVLSFVAFKKKYFSFQEFCYLLLPQTSKNKISLMGRFANFLKKEVEKEFLAYPEKIEVFGRSFEGPDCHETLQLIHDVIIKDQYETSKFIHEDSVIVDAGANIGVFTVLAANIAKKGKVIAFEPVSTTYNYLNRNTEACHNVIKENLGLGKETAKKNIFINSQSTGISVLEDSSLYQDKSKRDTEGHTEEVQITTLDAYLEENGLEKIDFIKIDTEGYEANVLIGAAATIKKHKPVIAMSAYHNPNDKEELPRLLSSIASDYVCELHHGAEEDFICRPI